MGKQSKRINKLTKENRPTTILNDIFKYRNSDIEDVRHVLDTLHLSLHTLSYLFKRDRGLIHKSAYSTKQVKDLSTNMLASYNNMTKGFADKIYKLKKMAEQIQEKKSKKENEANRKRLTSGDGKIHELTPLNFTDLNKYKNSEWRMENYRWFIEKVWNYKLLHVDRSVVIGPEFTFQHTGPVTIDDMERCGMYPYTNMYEIIYREHMGILDGIRIIDSLLGLDPESIHLDMETAYDRIVEDSCADKSTTVSRLTTSSLSNLYRFYSKKFVDYSMDQYVSYETKKLLDIKSLIDKDDYFPLFACVLAYKYGANSTFLEGKDVHPRLFEGITGTNFQQEHTRMKLMKLLYEDKIDLSKYRDSIKDILIDPLKNEDKLEEFCKDNGYNIRYFKGLYVGMTDEVKPISTMEFKANMEYYDDFIDVK